MENFKFKEDTLKINCDSAASWEKTPDTKGDVNGHEDPISERTQNISKGRKGENDVEMMKKKVTELEVKVDELKIKEMKEKIVEELSEEVKVVKEMFTNKMCEMQKDLLAMVEHCLNFEKELSQTKEENQKMQSQIKELVEERDRGMEAGWQGLAGWQGGRLAKDSPAEEVVHTKKSTVEEVAQFKTLDAGPNKCRIVTVSSGSLGSTPSPSKSPPSVPDHRPQVMPPDFNSTKIMWHHPTSTPVYTPGQPRLPVYHQGFSDQPYAQYLPPATVPDQYHYDGAFYPYGPYQINSGFQILPRQPGES